MSIVQIIGLVTSFVLMVLGVSMVLYAVYAIGRWRSDGTQIDPQAHHVLQQAYSISREQCLMLAHRSDQAVRLIERVKYDVISVEMGARPCPWAIADLKTAIKEYLANDTGDLISFRRQIGELPPE